MWIFSQYGFYSVVQHRDDPERFLVRARVANDLTNLMVLGHFLREIETRPNANYPYRFILSRQEWEQIAHLLVQNVDYPNFEERIHQLPDQSTKKRAYGEIWNSLAKLSEPHDSQVGLHINGARPNSEESTKNEDEDEESPDLQLLYERGQQLFEEGQESEALKIFDFLIEQQPQAAAGHFFRGIILARRADHEGAIESLRAGLQIVPSDVFALRLLAISCIYAGRTEAAIVALHFAIEVAPDDSDARLLQGWAYARHHAWPVYQTFDEWMNSHEIGIVQVQDPTTLYLIGLHFLAENEPNLAREHLNVVREADEELGIWLGKALAEAEGDIPDWQKENANLHAALERYVGSDSLEATEILARELATGWASLISGAGEEESAQGQFSVSLTPLDIIGGRLALVAFTRRDARRRFVSPTEPVTFMVSGGNAVLDLALQVADTLSDDAPLFALVLDPAGPYPAVLEVAALRQLRDKIPAPAPEGMEAGRRPATIPFLEARGQLSEGSQLQLVRLPKKGLQLPDAARLATYRGKGKARWNYDGQLYSLSALCQKIMQEFGGVEQPGPYAGPDYWGLNESVSLSQLAKQN